MWRKSPAANALATIFKAVLQKKHASLFLQLKHFQKIWLLKKPASQNHV